jgi:type IV secretory pathway VirB10-like protein
MSATRAGAALAGEKRTQEPDFITHDEHIMAKKDEPEFIVTDRRKFTAEGEVRPELPADEEEQKSAPRPAPLVAPPQQPAPPPEPPPAPPVEATPPPPTAAEQTQQEQAYRDSTKGLDAELKRELGAHRAQEFEMTFERFLASLYMSALVQLGLMHEQGGTPRVDLLGARQTIDTLEIVQQKTKGNLTSAEESFLQNCLYELRMAYVEVTMEGPRTGMFLPAGPNTRSAFIF